MRAFEVKDSAMTEDVNLAVRSIIMASDYCERIFPNRMTKCYIPCHAVRATI